MCVHHVVVDSINRSFPFPPTGNMDRHHYETFEKFGNDTVLLHIDNGRAQVLLSLFSWYKFMLTHLVLMPLFWRHIFGLWGNFSSLSANTLRAVIQFQQLVVSVAAIVTQLISTVLSLQIWASLQRWAVHPRSTRTVLQVQWDKCGGFPPWLHQVKIKDFSFQHMWG